MKKVIATALLLFCTVAVAEEEYSFLGAAKEYGEKAAQARAAGKADVAKIYEKMQAIKINAHKLSEKGEEQNWDEYYALEKKLEKLKKKHKGSKKK